MQPNVTVQQLTVDTAPSLGCQVRAKLEHMSTLLQEYGLPTGASVEEQQHHLYQQLRDCESKLQVATEELQTLRTQQAKEKEEVSNGASLEF